MARAVSANPRQLVYRIDNFPVIHMLLWITLLMKRTVGSELFLGNYGLDAQRQDRTILYLYNQWLAFCRQPDSLRLPG
jgi:hypothetical protein